MPADDRDNDRRILIGMLLKIEGRLGEIVHERVVHGRSHLRKEFIVLLPGPWQEVVLHFQRSREMLEKDELDWEYVEGIGLTGKMLDWKNRFLDETLQQGAVGRFFKIANSILGSLAKALPPLEVVKEYKEHVEAALKYIR